MDNRTMKFYNLYNALQEKWYSLKHENNANTANVRGYENVDVSANYYKMQAYEEVMEMIDIILEEA